MKSDYDIKAELKNALRGHLDKRVSNVFLEQSLSIIDQSAVNRESFAVAADRVSKRIALFIDVSLSQAIYSDLMALVGEPASVQGIRRRFPRVDFQHPVLVSYNSRQYNLMAENLSAGGIFISSGEPFPVNALLDIILSFETGHSAAVRGVVVNKKSRIPGSSPARTGMGIEFKEVDNATAELLRQFI